MNGKRVESILENRNTRTVVEANKASYEWALDPKYKDIMSCYSPLIDDVVNRYTHVSASTEDLEKKAAAGTFTAEMLGTCIYRCVGYDAFHSLASTCWEMDRDLGTEYHPRFLEYLKMVQKKDLSVAGALTEPRGKRNQKTLDWPDPYLSLKIVDKVSWLPPTCAYRLRADGMPLPRWHYLISGSREDVISAGVSVAGRVISEDVAGPLEHHVVDWGDDDEEAA
jgi:4-hydroxybutyryl-CoA dehydratase/vinylacetyl-CoA-Delta-isomerase